MRAHYTEFLQELWRETGLNRKHPLGPVELDIADYAANGPPLRGILAPRGLGKTHVVTGGLTCFRLFRNAERKVIVPSKSEKESKKTLRLVRGWINACWFLQHLIPSPDHLDSAIQFDVGCLSASEPGRQPSFTAIGIDGQLEGNRGHTIIPDDVETEKNTESQDARTGLDDRVKEFRDILYPALHPRLKAQAEARGEIVDPSEICYVGTMHHEETVYVKLTARKYAFRTWPILYPTPAQKIVNLAPRLEADLEAGRAAPGDLVFPDRFTSDDVIEKQNEGYRRFAMQHMLIADLGESNRYPLRLSDLIVVDSIDRERAPITVVYATRDNNGSTAIDPKIVPHDGFNGAKLYRPGLIGSDYATFLTTKAWIDPAGVGQDHTAISIVSQLHGHFWLKCCYGMPGGSTQEDIETLVRLCRLHGAREIFIESNADTLNTYRPLFQSILKRFYLEPHEDPAFPAGWKASMIGDTKLTHSTAQKEVRIITAIEPVLSNHRLIVTPASLHQPGMAQEGQLWFQLSRLTNERKCLKEDAKADSLAGVIKAFAHTLRVDPEVSKLRHLEAQVKIMDRLARGMQPKQHSWIT
jgi:hypothetical protein